MSKIFAAFSILALCFAVSTSAMAGAGYLKKDQPQAELSQGDGLFPGGHGGGGFGVSERTHGANGNTDPSGTNGNQASETGAAHSGNGDRGNAGGPDGGEGEP